jgi:hypothetical protein
LSLENISDFNFNANNIRRKDFRSVVFFVSLINYYEHDLLMGQETIKRKNGQIKRNDLNSYNEYKEFEGKKYTGMKVGGSHKWYYDKGEWKEKKIMPDKWEFTYDVNKRRAGHAPEGSGVPVGTEYHWYILAHQNVKKLDANSYTTSMTGIKYKLAHKRSTSEKWSTTDKAQKKRLIQVLEELVGQLKKETT